MKISDTIPELDRKGLREFGLATGVIFAVLFGLFFPWLLERDWPVWPWVIAGLLWVVAIVWPTGLRLVYRAWMHFGLLASRITTPLILGIVFYLAITPLGLFRRILGRDVIPRRFDPAAKSYRIPSEKNSMDRLEKPF